MKIWIDGVSREATPEEVAEFEAMAAEAAEQPVPEPTEEERLAALEEAMLELLGVSE